MHLLGQLWEIVCSMLFCKRKHKIFKQKWPNGLKKKKKIIKLAEVRICTCALSLLEISLWKAVAEEALPCTYNTNNTLFYTSVGQCTAFVAATNTQMLKIDQALRIPDIFK